jgi:hypothetical protein
MESDEEKLKKLVDFLLSASVKDLERKLAEEYYSDTITYRLCLDFLQLRHTQKLVIWTCILALATWFLVIATVFSPYLLKYFGLG